MKKFLILVILCFCIHSAVLAYDSLPIQDSATKQQLMATWLKTHPDKAKELKVIFSNSQNQTEALQKWLDANPDCASQLQNLVMPEGN